MQNLLREIAILSSTSAALDWDQETFAPPKAVDFRSKQLAYLAGKIHGLKTSGAFQEGLEDDSLGEANQRELRHQFERATKLPRGLVERASETSSLGKAAWSEAREKNDFSLFAPHLAKLLDIAREQADHWGYEDEPYDALLSEYERSAKTRWLWVTTLAQAGFRKGFRHPESGSHLAKTESSVSLSTLN